jgi:heme oxygenase
MLRLVSDDFTIREYLDHFSALLGFCEPFEAALAETVVGAVQTPTRSALLADDLRHLGLTIDRIQAMPRCEEFPSIAGPGTLGAARRLRRSLGAMPRLAFYHADASRTQARWTTFCSRLANEKAPIAEALCETALAVFDAFGNCLDRTSGDTTGTTL